MTAVSLGISPVNELIQRQGMRASGRLAVGSSVEQLRYRELLQRSHRLSARLIALGGRSGAPVGVCLPRGPRSVAATLAVLESGASALPIHPDASPGRVGSILAAADATTCLTDRAEGGPTSRPEEQVDPPLLLSRQGSWVSQILEAQMVCPLTPGDTMLHASSVESSDAGIEMFWPLCVGANVVAHEAKDPMSRWLACQRSRATVMVVSVGVLDELLDFQDANSLFPPPQLRQVVCTGEPLSHALASRFAEQIGRHGCSLHSVTGVAQDCAL